MSNHLFMGNGTQPIMHKRNKCAIGRASKNVTAVFSVCNEEASIGSIILLTRLYADRVIVVDDASSDQTAEIAKKAGAEVIIHETNMGKGASLETGFKAAANLGADIIVTMDSKGHHNPADIPMLVDPIITGSADMVNGSRYLNSLGRNVPIYRRVGHTILGKFTSINSGKITDCQTGFHAFAASTTGAFRFDAQGVAIESEILPGTEKFDLRIKEVEIGDLRDFGGPVKYIPGILRTVVKDIEINKPLYLYAVPGFALATCGFYMGLKFLEAFLLGIESLHFWSVFLMVFLSVAGVYMTVRGIVKHSLVEVTMQTETT
jgi:glycosyltransferase involved in cell wall biosynthesis